MTKLSREELVNEFKQLTSPKAVDFNLSHTDYIDFMEVGGSAYIDRCITHGESAIQKSISTLCETNSDILANASCVFFYFHISAHYSVVDIQKHIDIAYEVIHDECAMAFATSFDDTVEENFVEIVMIITGA
ncbi:hypothetical protein JHD46_00580 [Sulfurimonas sp. SAG-AH-194-C20]|nr:hypothetical protein [Sulfurimonas sp. SAG-AH-194-C20]MDF1878127.1 hypothetical protein [Sulfurimonas sp. SAG-AH-194-C20]